VPNTTSSSRFDRVFVPAIVTVYAAAIPLWSLGHVLDVPHRPSAAIAASLATACSIPLQLWLLAPAAVGRRPPHPARAVAAFAVINLAALPFVGVLWLAAGEQFGVLAVIYLPLRWSVGGIALLTAIPAGVAIAGHDQETATYFAQNMLFYPLTIGLLIWLVRAAAELQARRRELAESAVISERVRIDDELGAALGAALDRLIARSRDAARLAVDDPAAADHELRTLTADSRQALTLTRRMVSRYQAATVGSELRTAVALLTAAGVEPDVDVPPALLGAALDGRQLGGFRADLTTLLRADAVAACVITAAGAGAGLHLEIRGRP
jgi:two-component system, NarL family, sensor histidine kinase DesK